MPTGITTYEIGITGGGNREDLMEGITNIAPIETPLWSGLPKREIFHSLTEWLTDTLEAATTAAHIEGNDPSYGTGLARTRRQNYSQIFNRGVQVSDRQRRVNPAGIADEFYYQVQKKMVELARSIERTTFEGTSASGAGGTASEMGGISQFTTTNIASGGTGGLTEAQFNGLLEDIYNQGGNPDAVYCHSRIKRDISAFAGPGGMTRNIPADQSMVAMNAAIDMYYSDFGVVITILDRHIVTAAATNTTVAYVLERSKWDYGILAPVEFVPLAKTGSATKGMIEGDLTLRAFAEMSGGYITGVTA